jgi:hypothetical protein
VILGADDVFSNGGEEYFPGLINACIAIPTFGLRSLAKTNTEPLRHEGFSAKLVKSWPFELVITGVIILNAVLIFMEADFAARNPVTGIPMVLKIMETVFFAIFSLELAFRIWALRCSFFCGNEWQWNWFDFGLVLVAGLEEIMNRITMTESVEARQVTILRVLRATKLTKIVRMIRIFKFFRELRIMVVSIIATVRTLFWAIVCLVMIMSAFAVYFITVVSEYQAKQGAHQKYQAFFGSMITTMITLFQAITGGFDWGEMSDLLWSISPMASWVLFVYISMMQYAILNILTGICCSTASKTADDDLEVSRKEEDLRNDGVAAKLKRFLHAADLEGTGTISWGHLEKHLHDSDIRNDFKRLDLEPWHLHNFFEVLRTSEGKGEPSMAIEQFIRGCMRLRSNVKNIDLIAASHEQQEIHTQNFQELRSKIDELHSVLKVTYAHV